MLRESKDANCSDCGGKSNLAYCLECGLVLVRKHLLVIESGRNTRVPQDLEVTRREESDDVKSNLPPSPRVFTESCVTRISPTLTLMPLILGRY